jgi:hypothetical protein
VQAPSAIDTATWKSEFWVRGITIDQDHNGIDTSITRNGVDGAGGACKWIINAILLENRGPQIRRPDHYPAWYSYIQFRTGARELRFNSHLTDASVEPEDFVLTRLASYLAKKPCPARGLRFGSPGSNYYAAPYGVLL